MCKWHLTLSFLSLDPIDPTQFRLLSLGLVGVCVCLYLSLCVWLCSFATRHNKKKGFVAHAFHAISQSKKVHVQSGLGRLCITMLKRMHAYLQRYHMKVYSLSGALSLYRSQFIFLYMERERLSLCMPPNGTNTNWTYLLVMFVVRVLVVRIYMCMVTNEFRFGKKDTDVCGALHECEKHIKVLTHRKQTT